MPIFRPIRLIALSKLKPPAICINFTQSDPNSFVFLFFDTLICIDFTLICISFTTICISFTQCDPNSFLSLFSTLWYMDMCHAHHWPIYCICICFSNLYLISVFLAPPLPSLLYFLWLSYTVRSPHQDLCCVHSSFTAFVPHNKRWTLKKSHKKNLKKKKKISKTKKSQKQKKFKTNILLCSLLIHSFCSAQ